MAKHQRRGLSAILGLALSCLSTEAQATIYTNLDLESSTVNAAITNGSTHDGSSIELFSGDAAYPTPYTRNAITTPSGSRYHEVLTICGGYSANRCTPANNSATTTNQAGFVAHHTAIDWTTKDGQTFYLGGFFRFDRVGGRNVWASTDSFDKLWEFGGNGPDHSLRWGIGAGRHGNFTGWDSANTFTFDIWCADSVFDACEVPASNDWDHKPANTGGYSASNPYECQFERWYAVVIAVTISTNSTTGRIQQWINGTQIYDAQHITRDTGITSSDGNILHGTIAQGDYDAPDHYRRSDKLMFSDSITDLQNAGLFADPEAGGGGGGTLALFLSESAGIVFTFMQALAVSMFLWERRAEAVRAVYAVHALYWRIKYRRAIANWQRNAPIMLEDHSTITFDVPTNQYWKVSAEERDGVWQLRK